MRIQPFVGDGSRIRACAVPVINVAADTRPCSVVVLAAILRRGLHNVEQQWKFTPDPRPGIVLVGDGVDAQFRDELRERGRPQRSSCINQRLSEGVGAAPTYIHSGRGSSRIAARTIARAPSDVTPGPVAAMP